MFGTAMMTLGNMRENERVGWPIVIVTVWILIAALPAIAQTERWPSLEEIIKVTREAFRTAKNKDQVESVKLWCRDGVDSLSHNEKMGLLREGDRLINAGKMVEAVDILEKLKAIDDANDKLASAVCKPDVEEK